MLLAYRYSCWGGEGGLHGQRASGRRGPGPHKTGPARSRYAQEENQSELCLNVFTGGQMSTFSSLVLNQHSQTCSYYMLLCCHCGLCCKWKHVPDSVARFAPLHSSNNHQQSLCLWDEVHHDGSPESNVWTPGSTAFKCTVTLVRARSVTLMMEIRQMC